MLCVWCKRVAQALFSPVLSGLILTFHILGTTPVRAEAARTERAAPQADSPETRLRFAPVNLKDGASLTVISPEAWSPLADRLAKLLEKTHEEFRDLFGEIPSFSTSIRLMDSAEFYKETGAPEWTNAMYVHGQIIIPLSKKEALDVDNIIRSLRHEYTHAVVNALSAGRCPGWLDEGLAQWAEGSENPALRPALHDWLNHRKPISFSMLQSGFTKLDADMVPAAYAQSLFAAHSMITTFGFEDIQKYFKGLRKGQDKGRAFLKAFDLTETVFEGRFQSVLKTWQKKGADRKATN